MAFRGTIEGQVIISAKDLSGPAFQRAAANARGLNAAYATTNSRMARATAGVTTMGSRAYAAIGGIAGLGLAAAKSVREFAAWETKMNSFGKITNISGQQLDNFSNKFLDMAPKVGQANDKILEAANILAGKGLDTTKLDTSLKDIGKTATATDSDIGDIAKTSFTLMDALNIKAENIKDTFDALAQSGKMGSFELKDMAKELPYLAAQAKLLGMTGKEGANRLGAMMQVAMKTAGTTEEAANNMANLFGKIKSADTAKHLAKFLGVDIEKEFAKAEKSGEDFTEHMIKLITEMTKGDPFRIAEIFPDRQAQQAFLALSQYWTDYTRIRDKALNSHGVIDKDFDRTMASTEQRLQRFRNNIDRLFVAAGKGLTEGGASSAIDEINKGLESIESKAFGDFIAGEAKAAVEGLKGLKAELDFITNSPFWAGVKGVYNAIEDYKKQNFTQKRFDEIKANDERRLNMIGSPDQSIMDQALMPFSYLRRGIRDGKWDLPLEQIKKNEDERKRREKAIELQSHMGSLKGGPDTRKPLNIFKPIPGPYDKLPWGLDRNPFDTQRQRTLRDSIESGSVAPRRGRPDGIEIGDLRDDSTRIADHIESFVNAQAKKDYMEREKRRVKALHSKKAKVAVGVKELPQAERVYDAPEAKATSEIPPLAHPSLPDWANLRRWKRDYPPRDMPPEPLYRSPESKLIDFNQKANDTARDTLMKIEGIRKRVDDKLYPKLSPEPPVIRNAPDQSQVESGFARQKALIPTELPPFAPDALNRALSGKVEAEITKAVPIELKTLSPNPPIIRNVPDQSQIESGFARQKALAPQSEIKVEFPKELPPFAPDALNRALSGKVEAEVVKPVPVEVKHEGTANLNVQIRVDGGRVVGTSRTGSIANTKINTGVDNTGSAPVNPFEGIAGR